MIIKIIVLIFVNLIGAVTYPLGKISFNYGNPLFLTGIRMVIAGLLLIAFEWKRKQLNVIFSRQFVVLMLALSFFNVFFTNCLQFWTLNHTTASKAIIIFNTSPFIAAIFSYFLFGELMTCKKVFALIIAFLGFLPVILSKQDASTIAHPIPAWETSGLLLIAAISSVIGWLVMKRLLQVTNCSLIFANGMSMLLGGLLFFPTSWYTEGSNWYAITNVSMTALLMLALIFANNIVNYNAYAYFLKFFSATLMFLISFTSPLFALFFGWLFLGEKIGISFGATIIIVGIGLVMYYQEEKRLQEKHEPFLK